MSETESNLKTLTAEIVAAYVGNHTTHHQEISSLIAQVHRALATTQTKAERPHDKRGDKPAVDVKKSVFTDHLICLECGERLVALKRHLLKTHNLTTDAYRSRWNLPITYPMTAPGYSKLRSEMAKQSGLGHKR